MLLDPRQSGSKRKRKENLEKRRIKRKKDHAPVKTAVLLGVIDTDLGEAVAHGAGALVTRHDALAEGGNNLCCLAQLFGFRFQVRV
jgi:hypothetical protein